MATLPLIGISCAVQPVNDRPQAVLNATYTRAVLAAGGATGFVILKKKPK